jgi:hypothetical protein
LSTLLCCWPFGIVSIVFAAQVDSKWNAGDFYGSMRASKNARTWAWVAFGCGLAVLAIYLVALAAAGSSSSTTP